MRGLVLRGLQRLVSFGLLGGERRGLGVAHLRQLGQHGHALFLGLFEFVGLVFLRLHRVFAHLLIGGQVLDRGGVLLGGDLLGF